MLLRKYYHAPESKRILCYESGGTENLQLFLKLF